MAWFRKRPAADTFVMDDSGVRRLRDGQPFEQVTWDGLVSVEIVTTADGPYSDDVFWLLSGDDGTGVAVPSEQAPDGFLDRLQELPGFDDEAVIAAMGSVGDARFPCWRRA